MTKRERERLARQARALRVIRDSGPRGIRAREFADAMWPGSNGHNVSTTVGYGSHKGACMFGAGGQMLSTLEKRGLVRRHSSEYEGYSRFDYGWKLTADGTKALAEVDALMGDERKDIEALVEEIGSSLGKRMQ